MYWYRRSGCYELVNHYMGTSQLPACSAAPAGAWRSCPPGSLTNTVRMMFYASQTTPIFPSSVFPTRSSSKYMQRDWTQWISPWGVSNRPVTWLTVTTTYDSILFKVKTNVTERVSSVHGLQRSRQRLQLFSSDQEQNALRSRKIRSD